MPAITQFLSEIIASPVLRVLLVIGLGLVLGNIPFPGGFKLGVAAVLFAGLFLGALSPDFTIPSVLQDMGLILFVYGVGLQTGPGFFRSLCREGIRLNLAVGAAIVFAFLLCAGIIHYVRLDPETVAG